MSISKKLMTTGATGDTYVDDVFSTYLYEGTGKAQTIQNGIAIGDGLRGGLATYFDGTSNIKLNNGVEIVSSTTAYTVSFWIRTDDAEPQRPLALASNTYYSVERNKVRFYAIGSNGSPVGDVIHTCPDITNGQWHHVVHSVTTNSSVMYFDGVQASVYAGSMNGSSSMQGLSTGLALGGQTTTNEYTSDFTGSLANVFMDTNYRELTDESTLRLFINADGSPTSSATLEGLTPPVFFTLAGLFNAGSVPNSDFTVAGSPKSVEGCDQFITGEGGLVWIKSRSDSAWHNLFDTERGASRRLVSNDTGEERYDADTQKTHTSFNSDGFSLGIDNQNFGVNNTGKDYASWTFRKAPSFFDVVTYMGDGVAGREIPHNLGVEPGMVIVKKTNAPSDWPVWHRDLGEANSGSTHSLTLNASNPQAGRAEFATTQTATHIVIGSIPGGINANGDEYVAYLFAHDDSDEGMIQCGSYTGTGAAGNEINLGWEPQWVLIKRSSGGTGEWSLFDTMRGIVSGGSDQLLAPDSSAPEETGTYLDVTPTGFKIMTPDSKVNVSGSEYIYMAIRRPNKPAKEFEADELFALGEYNGTGAEAVEQAPSGFPVDFAMHFQNYQSGPTYQYTSDRLTAGKSFRTNSTAAEVSEVQVWDSMDGVSLTDQGNTYPRNQPMWRRAPGFFDVVVYTGNNTNAREVPHNLSVAPEMMWIKKRGAADQWYVYAAPNGNDYVMYLNEDGAGSSDAIWNYTDPNESTFTVNKVSGVNGQPSNSYIAYLFASVPGICDIGSYTGIGESAGDNVINCGFTNGARFVLIKRTDSSGDWYYLDTLRGITSSTSSVLSLNTTSAESIMSLWVKPDPSGFAVWDNVVNGLGNEYIYMAIA